MSKISKRLENPLTRSVALVMKISPWYSVEQTQHMWENILPAYRVY